MMCSNPRYNTEIVNRGQNLDLLDRFTDLMLWMVGGKDDAGKRRVSHHQPLKAYSLKRRRPFIGFVAPIWFGISFATTGRQTE
jgi:hypothetical protein